MVRDVGSPANRPVSATAGRRKRWEVAGREWTQEWRRGSQIGWRVDL